MTKTNNKKEPKKIADNYDSKLTIKGSLDDVIKASFLGKQKEKKEEDKKPD